MTFRTDTEVIAMANDTRAGLIGYFYSKNIGRVWRVAEVCLRACRVMKAFLLVVIGHCFTPPKLPRYAALHRPTSV